MLAHVLDAPDVCHLGSHHTTRAEGHRQAIEGRSEIGRCGRGGCICSLVHSPSLFTVTVPSVGDLFDFENLLPELILALGLALLIGNGLAWWKHRRGETPEGIEEAQYRPGRVLFLSVVGAVLTVWGAVTLFT